MAKYVRCSYCGKRIDIGEDVCTYDNNIYCDEYCFTTAYAYFEKLSEGLAKSLGLEVFDDAERIRELKRKISKTEMELKLMQLELAGLEFPNFYETAQN